MVANYIETYLANNCLAYTFLYLISMQTVHKVHSEIKNKSIITCFKIAQKNKIREYS